MQVIENVIQYAVGNKLKPVGLTFSPVKGAKGNIEYLLYIDGKLAPDEEFDFQSLSVEQIVNASHEELE